MGEVVQCSIGSGALVIHVCTCHSMQQHWTSVGTVRLPVALNPVNPIHMCARAMLREGT